MISFFIGLLLLSFENKLGPIKAMQLKVTRASLLFILSSPFRGFMRRKYFLTLGSKIFSRFRFRWDYIKIRPKSPEKGEGISKREIACGSKSYSLSIL